jgi:hypothetical protein
VPADDFDRWNAGNRRWTGAERESARAAWLAAEERLLDPSGRPLPEVVALAVLRGDHAQLGVLADWLADQGRLDPLVRRRLDELRRGVRVRFTQGFSYGNARRHGFVSREDRLPVPPFVGVVVVFEAEDHFAPVEAVEWDVRTQLLTCSLRDDPTEWRPARRPSPSTAPRGGQTGW